MITNFVKELEWRGLAAGFLLIKGSFDFVGANDGYYRQAYGQFGEAFVDALGRIVRCSLRRIR